MGWIIRIGCGVGLLTLAGAAVVAPVTPPWVAVGAAMVLGTALWRPEWAALLALALAPWGARLAGVPVRATELFCVAFLAGWLVRLDRSLRLPGAATTRALVPATAYGGLAIVSWVRLETARIPVGESLLSRVPWPLPPVDYLISAGRDPHTAATFQILLGVTLAFAVATLLARNRTFARPLLVTLALSGVAAALATIVAVPVRYWMSNDTNELIRYFVSTRSRYSFHVGDVNAAGSHFLLGAFIAFGLLTEARRRVAGQWAVAVITGAALWISGSRAAMATGVLLVGFWVAAKALVGAGVHWPRVPPRAVALGATAVLVALVLSPVAVGSASAMSGSARRSMSVREEFLVTSARMLATAPVLGVGVGTYYERSGAYMPPGIRELYGRENAHNYFMQTAAELGIVGLVAFVWWLGASLAPLWRRLDESGSPTLALGVLSGCVAFLLTCVTGHPFLVVEISVPFWATVGVAVSDTR